ncbi:MAG: glycosyltransferase [Anaerolineaceae bacterium]|nr:glycosyltransferase [Anaerolineaceae bacterium]
MASILAKPDNCKILISMMNLVSVIIPIHNRFPLVDEAVASVFDQTHRPIQLIIVDDCSDEPFVLKIASQPTIEVILIRHESNQGPGASRETGRQKAQGDYIAYLDSDDLWHPQKLAKQVAMLQAQPEAEMCYCTSLEFQKFPLIGQEKTRKKSDQSFDQFLPTVLSGRPWDTSACLWTRQASNAIGPWFPGWAWEDYAYDFTAGCLGLRITHLPETLCYYRNIHEEERLSESTRKTQVINRASAVLEMNQVMKKYHTVIDESTINRLMKILYYQAMHLFYLDEKEKAHELLSEVRINHFDKVNIFIGLLNLFSLFFRSKFLGHALYKFRKII